MLLYLVVSSFFSATVWLFTLEMLKSNVKIGSEEILRYATMQTLKIEKTTRKLTNESIDRSQDYFVYDILIAYSDVNLELMMTRRCIEMQ